jgi:class 3 adenylate cyclase
LLWDILCPVCRIPSQVIGTLRALRDHANCEACHVDFELDFANSVEMIFRIHPEIRESELGTYCVGGPAHSPHVIAQVRVSRGERTTIDLALGEGSYRLRGPQLPYSIDFQVEPAASLRRWELDISTPPPSELPRTLRTGGQTIALRNNSPRELVVRLERITGRDDALTAARASALALFRDLFPGEILSGGQLINLATVTLVITELDHAGDLYQELGDARAFSLIHEHFRLLDESVRRHGGALVKTVNEGLLAVFTESVNAVEAAFSLSTALAQGVLTKDLRLRVGVHRGPAMVATFNEHLDYFGSTVNLSNLLPRLAAGGGVILSPAVAAEPAVASFLLAEGLTPTIIDAPISGLVEGFALRLASGRDTLPPPEPAHI